MATSKDNKDTKDTTTKDTKTTDTKKDDTKVTVAKKVAKPITVGKTPQPKEVKPQLKDPKGKFNYVGCKTYTVKDGDTLLDIAQKYKVALQQLRYFNHLDKQSMKINAGQTIVIPKNAVYVPYGK